MKTRSTRYGSNIFLSLVLFASAHLAFASTILVRHEEGLSCCTVFEQWTLTQNAAPTLISWDNGYSQSFDFDIAYAGDAFTLTAVSDNNVAEHPYPLQLLAVYPGGVPPVGEGGMPPDCGGPNDPPCVNVLGYVQIYRFPESAGASVSVFVPPSAVPEPTLCAWLAAGLLALVRIQSARR